MQEPALCVSTAVKMNLRKSLVLVSILLVSPFCGAWDEGEPAPDLSAFELKGDLPKLEGKVVYVDFWASWCPPCKAAFPAIDRLYEKYEDRGFEVVAVSLDSTEDAMNRFLKRADPRFPIVWDGEQSLAADAGIEVMPTSFLIDANGVVRKMHRGWGGSASERALDAEIAALLAEAEL